MSIKAPTNQIHITQRIPGALLLRPVFMWNKRLFALTVGLTLILPEANYVKIGLYIFCEVQSHSVSTI